MDSAKASLSVKVIRQKIFDTYNTYFYTIVTTILCTIKINKITKRLPKTFILL